MTYNIVKQILPASSLYYLQSAVVITAYTYLLYRMHRPEYVSNQYYVNRISMIYV